MNYDDALEVILADLDNGIGALPDIKQYCSGWTMEADKPRAGYQTATKTIELDEGDLVLQTNIQFPPESDEPSYPHIEIRVRERG